MPVLKYAGVFISLGLGFIRLLCQETLYVLTFIPIGDIAKIGLDELEVNLKSVISFGFVSIF